MGFVAYLLSMLIKGYIFVIIIQVAVSWLVAFKVVDTENQQARNLIALLNKVTDPVMKPLQKYIPPIGGMDLSPLVAIIGLQIIERWVIWPLFAGY